MNPEFWNSRYADDPNAYGEAPNRFVEQQLPAFCGPPADLLELGSGTGRNVLWAAQRGYRTTAIDYSEAGLQITRSRAADHGVRIETEQADLAEWRPFRTWDAIVVTYLHLPSVLHTRLFEQIAAGLRDGGHLVGEWFAPAHFLKGLPGGGPRSLDPLIEKDRFPELLRGGLFHVLDECETDLAEGRYHAGRAAVVRVVWQKGTREPGDDRRR